MARGGEATELRERSRAEGLSDFAEPREANCEHTRERQGAGEVVEIRKEPRRENSRIARGVSNDRSRGARETDTERPSRATRGLKQPSAMKEKDAWDRGRRGGSSGKPKGELDIYIGDSRLYTGRNPFVEDTVSGRRVAEELRGCPKILPRGLHLFSFLTVPLTQGNYVQTVRSRGSFNRA